jgi:hypothetical protein
MLEKTVEQRLKKLENVGFRVLKLRTPGYTGTPDRMILWPLWAPRAPTVVEAKRPKKENRREQEHVQRIWSARGVDVRPTVSTVEEADTLVAALMAEAEALRNA